MNETKEGHMQTCNLQASKKKERMKLSEKEQKKEETRERRTRRCDGGGV